VASCEDAGASIVSDHSPAYVVTVEARAQFRLKDVSAWLVSSLYLLTIKKGYCEIGTT
jgi:hypothetical protein